MKLSELNRVERSFGDLSMTKDISMSIEEGEIASIISPSDSGKSTLLRYATMFGGMSNDEMTHLGKGAAWTGGRGKAVHTEKKELKEIRSQYGLIFQNFDLFPHCSMTKNITDTPTHMQERDKEGVYREAGELLIKMGLRDREDAYPCQPSDGQCQCVTITRVLALNSKILFLDEPTSALGLRLINEVLEVIKSLVDLDIAMVIMAHGMAFARDISRRVIFMTSEAVVEQGAPEQVPASDNQRAQSFLRRYGVMLQ